MNKLNNERHWAVILGASSGFGEAAARQLAKDGYNIIGVHLDRQATMHNVARIIDEIKSYKVESIFYNVNAADEEKRKEIIEDLLKRTGGKPKVKVVMHSLAFGTLKPFIPKENEQQITKAQIEMTIDVMANSLVYWVQDFVSNGLLVTKARIFAMTSSGGHAAIPYYGAVSAAKAALESHCRQLAVELGPMEVAVNAIMAGVTDTPALRKIPGNIPMIEVARRKNPRGKLTTPGQVAKIIALFCQEGGEWISGGIIHADGGEDAVSFVGQGEPENDSLKNYSSPKTLLGE
ncbi:MAG: 3-oxoacyl-ACP reductase [Ignavibacteria bacterium CG_4_8_14_3_um_filter_37_9]|nr:SDR family oxidoreductase [Ignavibacteria bacterium]OIO21869.1 MAG: 3-oxoacyl-ACP reductase [Ignavibacteria bacterium CG1_02_37_35]PIP76170.1 MAG: 3-oxoacyl-ACP reductase [Ignavibacteria bacterium CG22_combo_CG10-13_8_21_14_all_37_15]PIW98022.1 MAG: 3-oxoacyl-ACP reductase [Ignavibacteria bacterium CG_4_8_14_3_um_filter_37_9]PIX93797.1 MAG: 3-oxoacyl-ACP reductase [Ignavibacteria bacterium CG_4_10_14_3_um_filter_37_18]PJC60411.1 MAG: 3-oxoacyl-ACP reductase [Ignavibacteria bacterium CG_4_9_